MNDTIKRLNQQLAAIDADRSGIEDKLRTAWGLIFMASKSIKTAVSKLEASNEYTLDKYGEVAQWLRIDLSEFKACREQFEEYMRNEHFVEVDFDNEVLSMNQGESLIIQHDTRMDNGVWLNGKCVIEETQYKNEEGEIDEAKRNELIEAYMEKSGYFPGVFRVDRHGNVFAVKTQA